MTPLTVAVAQPPHAPGDLATNVAAHAAAINAAQARLVVFPELSLTGYDLTAAPVDPRDPALAPLDAACASARSIALVGAPVHERGRDYIATLAVTGTGAKIVYRKMCLGDDETTRFTPGSTPAVIEIDGCRIGLGICKDTRMPGHLDATLRLQPDLYIAGLVHHDHEVDELQARAHRIIAQAAIPVAFASAAGAHPPDFPLTAGHSRIWGADGTPLAELGPDPTTTPAVADVPS